MSRPVPPPPDTYDDNPEWTEADFARARPAGDVLPADVVAALLKPAVAIPDPSQRKALAIAARRQGGGAHYLALAA